MLECGGDQVGEAHGVDRFLGGAQFGDGPPAVLADVVGLRGVGRVDVGCADARKEVLLHLTDFAPADQMILDTLGELRPQLDGLRVDTEFFTQLAERRRGVVLSVLQRAAGRCQKPPFSS